MTIPLSGAISAAMVNQELGRVSTASLNLNETPVRLMASALTGAVSLGAMRNSTGFSLTPADIYNDGGNWQGYAQSVVGLGQRGVLTPATFRGVTVRFLGSTGPTGPNYLTFNVAGDIPTSALEFLSIYRSGFSQTRYFGGANFVRNYDGAQTSFAWTDSPNGAIAAGVAHTIIIR